MGTPFLLLLFSIVTRLDCQEVNVAGLFEPDQENLEQAFTYAIDAANKVQGEDDLTLAPLVKNDLEISDTFQVQQTICEILNTGIVGLFGPKTITSIRSVQSVCDAKEIPHIVTRWKPPDRRGTEINFYPSAASLSKAYMKIIETWGWTTFTVIYDDNESLHRIIGFVEIAKNSGLVVNIKQLDPQKTGTYRSTVKEIRASNQKYFVIDCDIERIGDVLQQLQQAGLMNENYNYFLTNLDAHTQDLTPFQFSSTNITGIRLLNPDSQYVQAVSEELFAKSAPEIKATAAWKIRTEQALIIDAMHLFASALNVRNKGSSVPVVEETNSLSCADGNSWIHGYSVVNIMKSITYEGLTGLVKFDAQGFRSDFALNIYELKEGGIVDIGNWNISTPINISRLYPTELESAPDSLRNRSFIVQLALTEPYSMLKESTINLVGNDRYEGLAVDLIEKLAELEGFNYTFTIREDKKNGAYDKTTRQWTGMIGDLINNITDLAITDFTITSEREKAVDFTVPFMNLGIGILFKKPKTAPPSFFSFADPFALDTWGALALSFFIVAFTFCIIGRICADEWTNPYPCIEEPEFLCNQFSLNNSIWFATGSLLCQGSEIAPIAVSTRMLAGFWWFFCLIMVASYTANLAAFLATENPVELFKDLQTLYDNKHGIKYGAKEGGATHVFFRDADQGSLYWQVGQYMEKHPAHVQGNDEGVRRAEKEDEEYAFFMESTSIEYTVQRHCSLKQYGKPLDEKGYGIAMRKNSPYRKRLSLAILKLQSSGYIDIIKRKWWEERRGGGACQGQVESSDADPLKLANVGGCFWVTIYGTIFAALLVLIEHFFYVVGISKRLKISFAHAFMQELRAYLNFNSNVKPVLSKESLDKSKSESEDEDDKKSKKSIAKSRSRSRSRSMSRLRFLGKSKTKSVSKTETNGEEKKRPYGFVFTGSTERLRDSP